jgi:DNA-binding LacI/PurR family transcriptional regulator
VDEKRQYSTVGSDNIKGGALVGRRFVQLGRKHVVFIGNRAHPEMAHRWIGLQRGLAASPTAIEVESIDVPDFAYDTAHAHALSRLSNKRLRRPDAFFAASDTMAIAVVSTIQELGLNVPDDISVIGYNDEVAAKRCRPALTTIRQDTRQAGNLLVEKLFQVLDGGRPSSATLPTELVVRET